jgi:hypothetical protein
VLDLPHVIEIQPAPTGFQLPAVDDIADQINGVGVVIAEKVEKPVGLAAARAEMNVGDEERTEPSCAVLKRHESQSLVNMRHPPSYARRFLPPCDNLADCSLNC